MLRLTAVLLVTTALSAPLVAQQTVPPAEEEAGAAAAAGNSDPDADADVEEIVVTGTRQPGAVIGDIEPELQLSPADIRAFAANDLAELLQELAPVTGSARGRGGAGGPVVLLNGRRIGGFREIRSIPPEAILRIDVLPEEAALQYGYRADQRVVNIVLRPRFQSVTTEAEGRFATDGGRGGGEIELNQITIRNGTRLTLEAEYERDGALFENERNIRQTDAGIPQSRAGNILGLNGGFISPALPAAIAGIPASGRTLADFAARANDPNPSDVGAFRTLLARTERFELGGTIAGSILGGVQASANLAFEGDDSRAALGLPVAVLPVPAANPFSPFGTDVLLARAIDTLGPLQRDSRNRSLAAAFAFNGDVAGGWRWALTANLDRDWQTVRTDRDVDTSGLAGALAGGTIDPFAAVPAGLVTALPRDLAESVATTARSELVVNGDVLALPAGDIGLSVRSGFTMRDLSSESTRLGNFIATDLGRDEGSVQANLDIPLTSRRRDVLGAIGTLSLNGNVEVNRLSDFGTLQT